MTIPPAPADVDRFREIIALRLGLEFDDGKLGFLSDVLQRRIDAGPLSCQQYLANLERAAPREEVDVLARELTVAETYFFRHIEQFRAFSEIAVPDRMRAGRARKRLRILSAGCASGEEAYTLAIAIRELRLDPSWEVSIRAVDVNRAVLERAAEGRYTTWSLRQTPPLLHSRWFSPAGREFLLDGSIKAQVEFEQRNLSEDDPDLWQPGWYDVVFCRNVIMYFTPTCCHAVVGRITGSLAPGGYLFLGHAETLRGMSHEFHLCHTHNAFYYRRKDPDEIAAPDSSWPLAGSLTSSLRGAHATAPDVLGQSWIEAIGSAADRIKALVDGPQHPAAPPAPVAAGHQPADLRPTLELLRQERFGEALGLVQALPDESASDLDVRLLEAVLLTHSGALGRAEEACRSLLEVDELNTGAHYLLALCLAGAGDRTQAIEHHQAASYLDPAFAMPRLHLGLLARRAGEHAAARRELGQALSLLQREDASRLLFFGGGFGRDALLALCRAELVACGGRP